MFLKPFLFLVGLMVFNVTLNNLLHISLQLIFTLLNNVKTFILVPAFSSVPLQYLYSVFYLLKAILLKISLTEKNISSMMLENITSNCLHIVGILLQNGQLKISSF